MVYNYEALNEQSFQKLVQALIVAMYPQAQCLPVAQPDGGRDAILHDPDVHKPGFVVFQVKYSRDPHTKTARDAIGSVVSSERDKVRELEKRGATKYILITNVKGTAHLDTGSIDRTNEELSESLCIPSYVWWRDDIDRRLDREPEIRWRYAEILPATDILPLLIKRIGEPREPRYTRTIKSYIATQYANDRDIKFKQIELKRSLIDLFVDLPIRLKQRRKGPNRTHDSSLIMEPRDLEPYLRRFDANEDHRTGDPQLVDDQRLAAALLLQMPLRKGVTRFVLEGAPGQGKSTVTQYLCQVNRLRVLDKSRELERVGNDYRSGMIRAPLRLDLRDYAVWINGRHPYSADGVIPASVRSNPSLESFLAMQISWESGASPITEDELLQFLERSHCVIVLDGFDEVADIDTRTRLVGEIGSAAVRFDVHAGSVQMIVTSRPAAFANSPGFPESDWIHVELEDLGEQTIIGYAEKWTVAQGLNSQERKMVLSTLSAKMEQPHLRDLARNPMQLSILLHLIHVQGEALPEKRTTLYEEYMKLFFNREAEKSSIVRDHRELILAIHGVLAWELQIQAENGQGAGSFTKEELQREIRQYLESEEHKPDLVDPLLAGTVERVGALVSRLEGTFEFEVQPLREYFAARHLYKTAAYSPQGRSLSGTRPDRFDALIRNSYWTNVTRFFCGFYDVGELGSLVDGLVQLDSDPGFQLISQTTKNSYDVVVRPRIRTVAENHEAPNRLYYFRAWFREAQRL